MPEFTNPFAGVTPGRKLTDEELARAIRLNIAAEHEAIHIYESHAEATDNAFAKKVLHDVANEEREHIGEFMRLLSILLPDEDDFLATGVGEVNEMLEEFQGEVGDEAEAADEEPDDDVPTVGGLKG